MILVTGSGGWLGQAFIAKLRRSDSESTKPKEKIRCLLTVDEIAPTVDSESPIEFVRGDIRDTATINTFLQDAENAILYHIAGIIHPPGRTHWFDAVNYRATVNLIDQAKSQKVGRIVIMSSNSPFGGNSTPDSVFDESSVYNPYMEYGKSKWRMELAARERMAKSGYPEIVIVRAPWFYGPYQPIRQTQFFRMIRNGRFPLVGNGQQKRSMAYVDNLVQGMLLAGSHPDGANDIFWIADAKPYAISEIIETVKNVMREDFYLEVKSGVLNLPEIASDFARLCDHTLQSLGFYHQKMHVLSEMNMTIACSIEKARTKLGYQPEIELREGMRRSIEWCMNNKYLI